MTTTTVDPQAAGTEAQDDAAREIIRALLAGADPPNNGRDYGRWGEPVEALGQAKEQGGTEGVRAAWATLTRQDPKLARLVAEAPSKGTPALFTATDDGNAERFAAQWRDDLRYTAELGWLVYDGRRWRPERGGEVRRKAIETIRGIAAEASTIASPKEAAEVYRYVGRCLSDGKISALLNMATCKLPLPAELTDFDRDPWLLNVNNGTLDLRTGDLNPHRRGDRLTKLTPVTYDPQATCPKWDQFLREIFAGDAELIAYVRRAVGYSLTGSIREHVYFLCYGTGCNGKSVLLTVVRALLGEYARTADFNSFLIQRNEAIRNDLAELAGARLVTASEAESGKRLAESLIKSLTGGETIRARYLFKEAFTYDPTFKIWFSCNHKPIIRGTDWAIWRRTRLIPFQVTVPEERQDKELTGKLTEELPGILNWAVAGCLEWQAKDRLQEPDSVVGATSTYRDESDPLAGFLSDVCVLSANAEFRAKRLYDAYVSWCNSNGEEVISQRVLGQRLTERGMVRKKYADGWRWLGLRLLEERET